MDACVIFICMHIFCDSKEVSNALERVGEIPLGTDLHRSVLTFICYSG
jgi:hypothetical protein